VRMRGDPSDSDEPIGALSKQWNQYIIELAGAVLYATDFSLPCGAGTHLDRSEIESVMRGMTSSLLGIQIMVEAGYEPYGSASLIVGIQTFIDGYSNEEPERLRKGWTVLDRTLGQLIATSASPSDRPTAGAVSMVPGASDH
jgi:hypothetical protein